MAYAFNGTDQYLSVNSAVISSYPYTLFGYGYTGDLNTSQTIIGISNGSSATDGFNVAFAGASAGDPVRHNFVFSPSSQAADTATSYQQNVWQTVFGVGSSATSRKVYLNGGNSATSTLSINMGTVNSTGIGALIRSTVAGYFSGQIAEAAIWNVALTDDEIASLAKGFKPTRVRPQSLVFYAPLVRDLQDLRGALTITNNNTATVAAHPRVY